MLLLWVEYVPHAFIGAAGLIVLAVAADFALTKIRRVSQRLRKAASDRAAKSVELVTPTGDNDPFVRPETPVAQDARMALTVVGQERMVRDTDRSLPVGAPTERHEAVASGADTERCEVVAATLEPVPDSASFSDVGEERREGPRPALVEGPCSDSASLVARAARELRQVRSSRLSDDVVTRDPSVRIVDVAVAPSGRVAS